MRSSGSSPFPRTNSTTTISPIRSAAKTAASGVTLFCLRRSEVEDLLSVLSALALRPHMVTISSCAQMSALLPCLPTAADACVIIGPEGDKLELSFIGDKNLIASHLFSAP